MKKKVLLTGSCGFIFSNFMRKVSKESSQYEFIGVDKIVANNNFFNIMNDSKLYVGDIADPHFINFVYRLEKPDMVIHGAAESFVDDSIRKALPFVHSNVLGTQVMVDMSIKYGVDRFVYVSTDEVYGQLRGGDPSWTEASPINPRNPYSASKAAGELIVRAANQTHGLRYNITRCCNNFGPRQPPRNLVPKVVTCLLTGQKIPIHGQGKQMREWIYVDDHGSAIMTIMERAPINETYNIGSGVEFSNLEIVRRISKILNKREDEHISFVNDRPGHDFRYSVDCTKIRSLGWAPELNFENGLVKCVKWYVDNQWYFDKSNEEHGIL